MLALWSIVRDVGGPPVQLALLGVLVFEVAHLKKQLEKNVLPRLARLERKPTDPELRRA